MSCRTIVISSDLEAYLRGHFDVDRVTYALLATTSADLDREATCVLARLGAKDETAGGAFRLARLLSDLSRGDWSDAMRILQSGKTPASNRLLSDLHGRLSTLLERTIGEGPVWSAARAELQHRRAMLPSRRRLRPPPPERLSEERHPEPPETTGVELRPRPFADIFDELASMPGMSRVHEQVRSLTAEIQVSTARVEAGLPGPIRPNRHIALVGPPGTGKTTVARLLAELYARLGILKRPVLTETSRAGLVGMYTGHTSQRTGDTVASALGGVLFIDEAYALAGDVFAAEALAELVRLMENHRDELIVFFAGYPDRMEEFIATNPGLASRIGTTLEFEPYHTIELVRITETMTTEAGFLLDNAAEDAVHRWFEAERSAPAFGNARAARTLVETMVRRHALRVSATGALSGDDLFVLRSEDVPTSRREPAARPRVVPAAGYL